MKTQNYRIYKLFEILLVLISFVDFTYDKKTILFIAPYDANHKNLQKCYTLLTRILISAFCKLYFTNFLEKDSSAQRSYDKPNSNYDHGLFCRYLIRLMSNESKR